MAHSSLSLLSQTSSLSSRDSITGSSLPLLASADVPSRRVHAEPLPSSMLSAMVRASWASPAFSSDTPSKHRALQQPGQAPSGPGQAARSGRRNAAPACSAALGASSMFTELTSGDVRGEFLRSTPSLGSWEDTHSTALSTAQLLELRLLQPWVDMKKDSSPVDQVKAFIEHLCRCAAEAEQGQDQGQHPWQQQVEAGNWYQLKGGLCAPASAREPPGKAGVAWGAEGGRVVVQPRTVGMVLLEQCFVSLLQKECRGATVAELVQVMVQGGLLPDAPLSGLLLEELWGRGEQQEVVRLLVMLEKGRRDLQQGSPRQRAPLTDASSGSPSQSSGSAETCHRSPILQTQGWARDAHPGAAETRLNRGELPSASADQGVDNQLPKAESATGPGSWERGVRQEKVQASTAGGALGSSLGERALSTYERLREEVQRRVLEHLSARGEELQEASVQLPPGTADSLRLPASESLRDGAPYTGLGCSGDRLRQDAVSQEWGVPSHESGAPEDSLEGGPDLPLHVVQCALERGQYRAALALPRRLRQEGLSLSVDVYDGALLAVVKEQEHISEVEQEMRAMESLTGAQPLSTVDQLIFQAYGETIRNEGELLLSWALEALQHDGPGSHQPAGASPQLQHSKLEQEQAEIWEDAASASLCQAGIAEGHPEAPSVAVVERWVETAATEATLHEKMLALWCLAGDSARAEAAMWRIAATGRPLSGEVLAAVLGTVSFRGDMDSVNSLMAKMEVMGHKPDSSVFSLIVGAAMRGGHLQVAAAAMLAMVERGLTPEKQQMASLLRLLQREGHVELYLILCSSLSGAGFVGPCLVFLYLDFINFCIIRML